MTALNEERPAKVEITYSINDLIALVSSAEGVVLSERAIKQHLVDGLLPPPSARGGTMPFGEEHVLSLRLVTRLSGQYVPLREMQRFVGRLSPNSIRALVERPFPSRLPSEGDAQAYLSRLSRGLPSPLLSQELFTGALTAKSKPANGSQLPRGIPAAKGSAAREHAAPHAAAPNVETGQVTRSQWLRVTVDPDVEINVRANGHDQRRLLDALVAAMQDVLAHERGDGL